jgi:hypothetical protein
MGGATVLAPRNAGAFSKRMVGYVADAPLDTGKARAIFQNMKMLLRRN